MYQSQNHQNSLAANIAAMAVVNYAMDPLAVALRAQFNQGGGQFPQRQKVVLDDPSLRLTADPLQGGTGRPTLKVYPNAKNSLRVDIYTNMPNEENNGNIRADIPYVDFQAMCEQLLFLADPSTPNNTIYSWEAIEFQFFGGKRSDTKQLVYTAFVGKDENGRIFFSVRLPKADRSIVQFFFDSALRLQVRCVKGPEMTPADISRIATRAWVNRVNLLINQILPTVWVDKSKQGGQGQGGQGGNFKQGGRPGGGNGNFGGNGGGAAPAVEELPW